MLSLPLAAPAWSAAPGSAAPQFSLPGRDGQVALAAYRGKHVYLDFWASWCAPCKRSFPWMGELQKRFGPSGLVVVAVDVDATRADADRFLADVPAGFTVTFDPAGSVARQFAIKGMPSSMLIDPSGQVLYVHEGFTKSTPQAVEKHIEQALKK
ncbi:TlpA family protein disulfide reductase [Massilia cavernae]|uniref:TlpA family protein disulfide reductase n=2 Tax=Massilia cavernae TaxID=2320864 RepID=A0A418Y5F7_9BURK|nr:TlpA family protein disulfide reductase [Massilia cavernae]